MDTWLVVGLIMFGFCFGVGIGIICEALRNRSKAPMAGNILVDLRRNCNDVISIESPKNMSKWAKYKKLTFNVVVLYESHRKDNTTYINER